MAAYFLEEPTWQHCMTEINVLQDLTSLLGIHMYYKTCTYCYISAQRLFTQLLHFITIKLCLLPCQIVARVYTLDSREVYTNCTAALTPASGLFRGNNSYNVAGARAYQVCVAMETKHLWLMYIYSRAQCHMKTTVDCVHHSASVF